jgi:hypothetical protein
MRKDNSKIVENEVPVIPSHIEEGIYQGIQTFEHLKETDIFLYPKTFVYPK